MESANNYYIIQELCESDLEKYLKVTPFIPEQKAIDMLSQIVNGFLALVREGIIHRYPLTSRRDMKPANVLISGGELKIADFGFAKKNVTRKMKNDTAVGTPLYMSL
jgi:serine/threonine protein kinase